MPVFIPLQWEAFFMAQLTVNSASIGFCACQSVETDWLC